MNIDLESMSREDLEKLRADVDKALRTVEQRRKAEARKAAEAKAREMGFSLEELVGGASGGAAKKPKSPAKYRDPADPTKTWTGRGRQPGWIKNGLAKGKSLEDFAI